MTDAFLLGAGFSKAICASMPTMKELYEDLETFVNDSDGVNREVYEYADGNVETLLSYYAIPSPHDNIIEQLRKQSVTIQLENAIGEFIQRREIEATNDLSNALAAKLVMKWHERGNHVLTTNYDTLVESIARQSELKLHYTEIYPVPVSPAIAREGAAMYRGEPRDTFTLYKLHGSTTWFKSNVEIPFDTIYGIPVDLLADSRNKKFITDKRRFIVPPVYDKSSLLNHESIRNLWNQAKDRALREADNLYVIGYSLPKLTRLCTYSYGKARGYRCARPKTENGCTL